MLLKEQGTLQTPVGVFSAQHEPCAVEPEQAKFYKQLIPLSKPGAGEQYAFKVDLDKCTGCKSCVSACHSLNGLDDEETWRDVGTIHGVDLSGASYTQTVTTACHHCADPACLNGCPVLAYEKDPATGIVRHLDDQCIGCQYCALKCPYDVPKYSKSLGIVRKCDMCQSRLADGEAPACVQACPTEAISITIVNTVDTLNAARAGAEFLPAAPEASYTAPTTQYVTARSIPDHIEAADLHELHPEHGHFPLVLMLVLTQLSVGLYGFATFAESPLANYLRLAGFVCMAIGLAASTSHLGRPLGAWRAFLGLRRSWLSREIMTFGLFSGVAALATIAGFVSFLPASVGVLATWATFIVGLLGVFTSVMIYHDTKRSFWAFPIAAVKFFGTTLGLAAAAYLLFTTIDGAFSRTAICLMWLGLFSKLILEATMLGNAQEFEMTPDKKSALLMLHPLRTVTKLRFSLSLVGLIVASLLFIQPGQIALPALAFICLFAAELLERSLFFRAVAAPKMPGGVQS
ncbi:DmsC/YnfH family molybdoenzyme membrane anchor subunit [Coraliomargarita sp. W4R72]